MTALKHKLGTILWGAGRFCYELICPRTREEYACLLVSGQGQPERRSRYPWLFFRVFAAILSLFAVSVLCRTFFNVDYATGTVVGAMLFSLPVLVLLYELCPGTGMGLCALAACAFFGGGLALLSPFNTLWQPEGDILKPLSVGIMEEAEKAVVTVVILLLTRKKSPVEGLLIGAAVGCGFGVFENVQYLVRNALFDHIASSIVGTAFSRGVMQYVTHIGYTAAVGWAFRRFRRPLIHPAFWGVLAGATALHALWDMKSFDAMPAFLLTVVGGATVFYWIKHYGIYLLMTVFWFLVLRRARRAQPIPDGDAPALPFTRRYASVLALTLALTAVSGLVCGYGYTHRDRKTVEYDAGTVGEFISAMQNGLDLHPDLSRPYDPNAGCDYMIRQDGQITYVTQSVGDDEGGIWHYEYYPDDESGEMKLDPWVVYEVPVEDEEGPYLHSVYPGLLFLTDGVDEFNMSEYTEGTDYLIYYPVNRDWLPEEYRFADRTVKDGRVVYTVDVDTTPFDSPSDKALVIAAGACIAIGLAAHVFFAVTARRKKTDVPPTETPSEPPDAQSEPPDAR